MIIYNNPDYEHFGYSGGRRMQFQRDQFLYEISQGSTNSGAHPRVRTFLISVSYAPSPYNMLFELYAYEDINDPSRGELFNLLLKSVQSKSVENDADHKDDLTASASLIWTTACKYAVTLPRLMTHIVSDIAHRSHSNGKREVQDAIKAALDIKDSER
jgi:hypothetical protein